MEVIRPKKRIGDVVKRILFFLFLNVYRRSAAMTFCSVVSSVELPLSALPLCWNLFPWFLGPGRFYLVFV